MKRRDATAGWQQVWAVFEQAVALPADARRAFLDDVAAGDDELRRAVSQMLAADEKPATFLDRPAISRAGDTEEGPIPLSSVFEARPRHDTESISGYRLLRQIGQGGMSTVYLAVREADAFRREVVVKVVRRDVDNEVMASRLRVERQILASLGHPNIARLYDVGATDAGRPFLVMEHVEGLVLSEYCACNRLSVADRLLLFQKIASAVAYAHQNLVVHRDLKPSNILVAPAGEPMLLDFGIAKLLEPDLLEANLEATAPWHRALTPSYASPEQIRGQRTTTACDVYSLGVVLYELLTGRLPHDFRGKSPAEIEHLITAVEPARPSAAVAELEAGSVLEAAGLRETPEALRRTLGGDLDAIVLEALRARPRERYASVEQLIADLERHRSGLPVAARRGTWRYRALKSLRRHRTSIATATLIALLLVGFAGAMTWQAARTARERDQARLERDKKQQVVSLVLDVFALSNPYVLPGRELTVREALERSVPLLEARLEQQPAVRAELLHTAGSILGALGHNQTAAAELAQALALRRQLYGDASPDVIETLSALSGVQANLGDLDAAEAVAREAVAAAQNTADEAALLAAINSLVYVLCNRSEYEAAAPLAEQGLRLARRLPASTEQEILALEYLALVESAGGDYAAAEQLYRQAVEQRRAHYGAAHPSQINALNNLGLVQRRQERLAEAEASYREAIDLELRTFGDDFEDPVSTVNLAGVKVARRDFAGAEALYRQALERVGGAGSDHWLALHIELAIASARVDGGQAAAVEAELRRLIERVRAELGDDHWRLAQARSILGACLSARGRLEEAEPLLIDAFQRLREGAKDRYQRDALERLAQHFERTGRGSEIEQYQAMLDNV